MTSLRPVRLFDEHRFWSTLELADYLHCSQRTVQRHITRLVARGRIVAPEKPARLEALPDSMGVADVVASSVRDEMRRYLARKPDKNPNRKRRLCAKTQ